MNVAALFSGGKDSVYAIHIAQQWGWEVRHLITINSINPDSYMFHTVNIHLAPMLAEALQIPLIIKKTDGQKETELNELADVLKKLDVDGVISGAIASEYQRTRIEQICHQLQIKSFTPLWHKDPFQLVHEQISQGFKIMIVGVFSGGLDEKWLGSVLSEENEFEVFKRAKKFGFNPAGEGGEFETLVLNCPIYKKGVRLEKYQKVWKRDHGFLKILSAQLVD